MRSFTTLKPLDQIKTLLGFSERVTTEQAEAAFRQAVVEYLAETGEPVTFSLVHAPNTGYREVVFERCVFVAGHGRAVQCKQAGYTILLSDFTTLPTPQDPTSPTLDVIEELRQAARSVVNR